jgi:multicomponent Na+:H+ antiporter subunit C
MTLAIAILVGVLVAVAVYLLLHSDAGEKVFGLILLGHGANLAVFAAGQLHRAQTPILRGESGAVVDPLPQALVLTAIVIGFGLVAFAAVLIVRLHQERGG